MVGRQFPDFEERLRQRVAQFRNIAELFMNEQWIKSQRDAENLAHLHPVAFSVVRELAYEYYQKQPSSDWLERLERRLQRVRGFAGYERLAASLSSPRRHFLDHLPELEVACWLAEAGYQQLEFEPCFPRGNPDIFVGEVPCVMEVKARKGRPHETDLAEWEVRRALQFSIAKYPVGLVVTFEPPQHALGRLRFYPICHVDGLIEETLQWLADGGYFARAGQRHLLATLEGEVHIGRQQWSPVVTQVWVDPGSRVGVPPHVVGGTQGFWEEAVICELGEWLYTAALSKSSQLPYDIPGIVAVDVSDDLAGSSDLREIVAGLASGIVSRRADPGVHDSCSSDAWPKRLHAVFLFAGSTYGAEGLRRGGVVNPGSAWLVDAVDDSLADLVSRWCEL